MPMLIEVGKGQSLLTVPDRQSIVFSPCRWLPIGAIRELLHVLGLTAFRQDYHGTTTKTLVYHDSVLDFVMVCCGLQHAIFPT